MIGETGINGTSTSTYARTPGLAELDYQNQSQEAPFDSLQIRPADGNIEIFEHEKRVKSFAGLDWPQSWILMLRWL